MPYKYIHILDKNTSYIRLEVGPQTFIRQDHEDIISGDVPLDMIVLPIRTYCRV